ncbi:FMN-binding glutamate synthase family protein [Methylomarinum sp. Ch1-1]|uniref:FMN-binding glutamate synthase family protein n=1 Tax=Methylomarinum roseum TaxID=3067653 RepID=A0AAU7NR22_9GAMM|nr:FMN-binding glutamate synthase family protein [Methylomarinum sp. Ch1-1]MDP4520637.1 FMN-binding glutamate synthase family protein [Methylomarinum sp. Ch1-1]
MRLQFIFVSLCLLLAIALFSYYWRSLLWTLAIVLPVVFLGLYDMLQRRHSLLRNYPVIGRARRMMESLRPMVQQYFIEPDTEGAPINRVFRSVVYQRAKCELDTVPYGTKFDVYRVGYEWIGHSLAAQNLAEIEKDLRVTVGGRFCKQPYSASILNISAMSFGALSRNAIMALNGGAALGDFAHNTGEGGLSDHHLQPGGDLIWQIGTAYFGCRNALGLFDESLFAEKAAHPQVKMIEIKLSQGAKPGHGGVLPACKNTPEIAAIRGVEAYKQVNSPAVHSAFSSPLELMAFIRKLRDLSDGKPVGFKLSIGRRSEFIALCKAMLETGITPDFITVDGGEGGTGAAPLEYTNSVGMPLLDALAFVSDCLVGFGLKPEIKIIASGKVFTGFHLVKRLALGADLCNSARGMMLALGCIQSLQCNKDTCPTGIATQNKALMKGLVVTDKKRRVANFQRETVISAAEIIAAAGLRHTQELNRSHIFRRVSATEIKRYADIYPSLIEGCLLSDDLSDAYREDMRLANSNRY